MATNTKPTVISTFAGCGGSSLGYKLAGFKELLAIDFEPNARDTFKANFPEVPFWCEDIKDVSVERILRETKLKPGELDVFDGSPPCQGFSTAGKRKVSDPRSQLFLEYVRLLKGLKPKVFIMENVAAMARGRTRGTFNEVFKALQETGYTVKASILNAKYYGVPQSRERLIFIGVRKDLGMAPSFPKPNGRVIGLRSALQGLVVPESSKRFFSKDSQLFKYWTLAKAGNGLNSVHPKGNLFTQVKVSPLKPCPTITKHLMLYHWKEPRYLTTEELKRASSFPDSFTFIGSPDQQAQRIGNAVMPKFMQAIAEHIKTTILAKEC